ncbi:MAG TPA: energy transducer TonB [Pyrinomonadaceae bacterium]|nr:energy transducer TonB [Pyrinomonadaceae bacterium]
MKKTFITILLLTIFSISVCAQTVQIIGNDWKINAPSEEIFSVESPNLLNFYGHKKDTNEGVYDTKANTTYFFVVTFELKNTRDYKIALDFINSFKQKSKTGKVGEFDSEKVGFADNDGFYHNVLILRNNTRIYIFQTVSQTPTNPAVERFFCSIKMNDTELNETASLTLEDQIAPTQNQQIKQNNSTVTDNPSSGIGSGNKPTTTPTPTQNNGITQPLKLTMIPKPSYTDLARFYNLQGTVLLRVTFLSNGIIGSITPVNKLPFGLTTQAIKAAKQVRFEPAMRNGVAYSVTKPVQYAFSIY